MRCLVALCVFLSVVVARAEETKYTAIFWNVESGDSYARTIGRNMAEKGPVDFWGLSEVPHSPSFLATLKARVEGATGLEYVAKLSRDGGGDRLAILYRSDRFSSVPFVDGLDGLVDLGENFFEVKAVNTSQSVRPAMGVQLRDQTGQAVVVLVNHLKAGSDGSNQRTDQAEALNRFAARSHGLPVISGGDHNIPINRSPNGRQQEAFRTLLRSYRYIPHTNAPRVGSFRSGSVLDSVFISKDLPEWESEVTILNRIGNQPATSSNFNDSRSASDHRPLRLVLTADSDDSMEMLEEEIREMEVRLEEMRAQLAALRAARDSDEAEGSP